MTEPTRDSEGQPRHVPVGPPPPDYQGAAPSSTWDDWLLQRPDHLTGEAPGLTISAGDVVAVPLRYGLWQAMDFAQPAVRDGLRELFEEYEEATAGQWTTLRDETQLRGAVIPWSELQVKPADGQISVAFRVNGDFLADYRLTHAQAIELVKTLMSSIESGAAE